MCQKLKLKTFLHRMIYWTNVLDEQKVGKLEEMRKVFSGLLIMVKLQGSAGEGNIMKIF